MRNLPGSIAAMQTLKCVLCHQSLTPEQKDPRAVITSGLPWYTLNLLTICAACGPYLLGDPSNVGHPPEEARAGDPQGDSGP